MMCPESTTSPDPPPAGPTGLLRRLGIGVHLLLLLIVVGVIVSWGVVPFVRSASRDKPVTTMPAAMESVDWHSPESSLYCLACHKQVAPAMGGRDVARGHPHNVRLSAAQLQAVRDLGTVAGPEDTLICMSCHKLGRDVAAPYMLADTLTDSRLCLHCHPEQVPKCDSRHDLRKSAHKEQNRLGQTAEQGGPCSACHLAHFYARDSEPSPLDPDGRCVPCHQIGRGAARLARTTMEHPESHCLECHDPHDSCAAHFLKQPPVELCLRCHDRLAGGPKAGVHPLGRMDRAVPQELIDAGALVGSDRQQLTCLVCHSTHSSTHQPLLLMEPDSNRLCLACHEKQLADKAPGGMVPRHGQMPVLTAEQQAVVKGWDARVGPDGKLLCVSCHRVHEGQPEASLLAFKPQYEEGCAGCHPQQTSVVGSAHDLRTNFPEETNVAGKTARAGGACSPCHLAHQPARPASPTAGDPGGQCVNCHRAGQCGEKKVTGKVDHPKTKCTDCHNPHENRFGHFLVKAEAGLCASCHAEQAKLIGGPHDRSGKPGAWPKEAAAAPGRCLPCHVPHGGQRPDLFRFGTDQPDSYHDAVCLHCHKDAAWGAPGNIAVIHPHAISKEQKKVALALVPTDAAGNMRMGCRTCHHPHGGAEPVHLARVAPNEPTAKLCLHCHAEKEYIRLTGHAPEKLKKLGFDVDSCKPCHAMHANREASWEEMLSPRFLMEACKVPTGAGESCLPCLACHHAGGPAPVREVVSHPSMAMTNVISRDAAGYLPLYNAAGREDPNGQVVCRTCHLSHGRLDLLKLAAENQSLTPEEQRASRMQLRGFNPPNVCTECHGEEARVKFLFFHNPERRKNP